jgi:predicted AlkP superfamily pyrophosphatase or phosphodiesterase
MTDEPTHPSSRRVVVFGVDGVRFDTLQQAHTPHIDAIAAAGFLVPVQVNPAGPTISGPSWTTVATGVLAPTHKVFDNDLRGHRIDDHPDFLTRVRTAWPGALTYAAANWPPLVHESDGGPIFRAGGFHTGDPGLELDAWEHAEELVIVDAITVLGGQDVAAAFVYLGVPDVVAHALGVCPAYTASVERSDERIGRVLDAIRARPSYPDEEWTIVVVTDHGHVEEGGHGGDTEAERTAWIAASGPTVPRHQPTTLEQADVHPHVLDSLGIAIDPSWELAGQPFGASSRAAVTPS